MEDAGNVPRAVDERQRRERDEVRAGAFGEGVDGELSQAEAVHFEGCCSGVGVDDRGLRRTKESARPGVAPVA